MNYTRPIIIAEDEESVAELLERIILDEFPNNTPRIDKVENGQGLIDKVKNNGSYGLIITDEDMPGTNGSVAIRELRRAGYNEVNILSTSARSSREEALKSGANDYIPKPFNIDEVGMKIKELYRP